ncbi:hypothetical protein SKAU_G00170260 [Synaphobranchus kaupii]|uniref:Uncharacterized protein n=1 Tax=Synaphobranchus kaupii TaxID=118154 RepID=A0A9Q1FKE9_SYNKA|nr:hypothetical protein SKAU_G00170260 [Synaphobranchus kaupii]
MRLIEEIMTVLGDTLFEYQEETERTKRENEILKRRLRDVELDAEARFPQSAPPLSVDRSIAEQQEWSSTEQDTESTLTAVKLEFTELQRDRQDTVEPATVGSVIPSPCLKRECDQDSRNQPTFPTPCGKRDCKQDSQSYRDLKMQIGNTKEEDPVPNVIHYQEIMQVVGDTLIEYQEETDRTKRENEFLRRRLQGTGLGDEAANVMPQSVPPRSVDRAIAVKLEFTELQRDRQGEEEHRGLEPAKDGSVIPSPKRECDQDTRNQPTFPTPCGKQDCKQGSQSHPDLKMQIGNTEEEDPVPTDIHYQVVGDTLIEYQEETDRTKRENEFLRRRLQWAGLDDEAAIPKSAPPLSVDRAIAEQQEWSSTRQDTESTLTAVKLEFTELQRDRRVEEEHQGLEPATVGPRDKEAFNLFSDPLPVWRLLELSPRIPNAIVDVKYAKMTKLQFLNAFFAERLMAVMQEIMQVVGDTLIEYQEETDRTKRENEILRRRLQGAGLDDEAALPRSAPPLSVDRAIAEQQGWSSTEQDTESTLTAVKLEFTELQRDRQDEEEHRGLEPATVGSKASFVCLWMSPADIFVFAVGLDTTSKILD